MTNAMVVPITGEVQFMPRLTASQAIDRYNSLASYVRLAMVEGKDFGKIPGSTKPSLLKPGAEKLCTFFGLTVEDPEIVSTTEDWVGERFGGEPFFYYQIRQRLSRDGSLVASQMGSCNSRETKYRWRQSERVCPSCGKPTVFKSKADKGGGYYCWTKKGGCGAQFQDGDQSIESQQTGRIANPDIADLTNTILKMALKRALIATVLVAVNASEFFTQDMEDIQPPHTEEPKAEQQSPPPQANGKADPPKQPSKLNPVQVTDLKTRIEGTDEFNAEKFCKHYHIESGNPYDLPPIHFDDAMDKLSRKPARKPQLINPDQTVAIESLLETRGVTVEWWEAMLATYNHGHVSELLSIQATEIIEDLTAMQPVEQGIVV